MFINRRNSKHSIDDIKDLLLEGMVGFIDPIREESKAAIATCKKGGIDVLMITGDHALTNTFSKEPFTVQ